MSALRSPGSRISVSEVDGWVVVAVVGWDLFDLVDDFLAAETSWTPMFRLPSAGADAFEPHLIYLPAGVSVEEATAVLSRIPPEEAGKALGADGVA